MSKYANLRDFTAANRKKLETLAKTPGGLARLLDSAAAKVRAEDPPAAGIDPDLPADDDADEALYARWTGKAGGLK